MSSPSSARRPPARAAVVAGVVLALVVAVVVTLVVTREGSENEAGGGTPAPAPTPTSTAPPAPLSTPLDDYDTGSLVVQRAGFCDLVDPESISAALGGEPRGERSYGNGESVAITEEVTDIAHEHGCVWERRRSELRAWVFAPPVTPRDAERLVADARGADGCAVRRRAPAYGSPSIARTCARDGVVEASYRGLFGDAWLACSLTTRGGTREVLDLAGAWCVEVAEAASQPPA